MITNFSRELCSVYVVKLILNVTPLSPIEQRRREKHQTIIKMRRKKKSTQTMEADLSVTVAKTGVGRSSITSLCKR